MPGAQVSLQLRLWGTPLTVARHSMQMPMPQRGARGSPCTEIRLGWRAIMIAAATLAPSATCTGSPLTVIETPSLMDTIIAYNFVYQERKKKETHFFLQ
jgi:hypothetical protein